MGTKQHQMATNEGRAAEWMDKADKKLKAWAPFSGGTRFEEAAEMYIKAANMFKLAKHSDEAGAAFVRAAECQVKSSKHEAATSYQNAANCYRKTNVAEAVHCMKTAVDLYTDEGRFSIAAKQQKEVAELYESELDFENAIAAYTTAAEFYEGEGQQSASNQCLLKVAHYSAQQEKYEKAIEIYEKVAKVSMDSNLLKWSVKEYFLKAGLCHLCADDIVSAKRAVEIYQEMDVTFASQREAKFLQEIIAACEATDAEAFTASVVAYDQISKLDQWKTTILLRIKNALKNDDGGLA